MRTSVVERKTSETHIRVSINLDGKGENNIKTGVPFLDHMLTQIAVHGLIDLEIDAQGDLAIDPHHTVEDTALTLGQAFAEALGGKAGIERVGQALVPMDESLCRVIVDVSGRPYLVFMGEWESPMVANIPVSLIEHFFYSFSMKAGVTLHVQIFYGRDNHHKTEALFKAFGRALRQAVQLDPRRSDLIPSSKGVL